MNKKRLISLGLVVFSFILSFYFYPLLPERIASHWGFGGGVNGYMPKLWGVFLLPLLALMMYTIFWSIPKLDPLKANIERFRRHYDNFILLVVSFLVYLNILTLIWNYGVKFNMTKVIIPAISIFIYYCGVMIQHSKRNWFVGIRTPWTMSSDLVWEKTHLLGGKLFKVSAIVSLIGFFTKNYSFVFLLAPLIGTTIFTFFYSYLLYRKLHKVS